MSRSNWFFGSAIAAMAIALVLLVASYETPTDRVEALGQAIKCPVCQGESIGNSPAQMARDMMALVRQRVDEGFEDQEIVDELLASYSGAVLLDPPASGSTLVLWLAPLAVLVAGIAVIAWWRGHPGDDRTADHEPRPRRLAPALFLTGALAVIVVVAGFFVQDRDGPATGVAAVELNDLDDVSNETLEAVISANGEHPEIDGMRLALGERYFDAGDFSSAFPHYLNVAQSPNAADAQVVDALVHLGWMAWEGNGEVDAAVGLFDQALAIDDSSPTAMFLKGQVLWCSATDYDQAAALFDAVLGDPSLEPETRSLVASDLAALKSGAACA